MIWLWVYDKKISYLLKGFFSNGFRNKDYSMLGFILKSPFFMETTMRAYIYIYTHLLHMCIYVYTERERERERERVCVCVTA